MQPTRPAMVLTKKHRLFVEAYAGDGINAMLAAGYIGAPNYLLQESEKLLANPVIMEAIKERSRYTAKTFKVIADREERQALLTSIMRNEDPHHKEETDASGMTIPPGNIQLPTRLKALELLGKSEGDFTENINLNANVTMADIIMQSYKLDTPVEDIEAEYYRAKEQQALPAPSESVTAPSSLEDFL